MTEAFFFLCHHSKNEVLVAKQVWVRSRHDVDCSLGKLWHDQLLSAQQIRMAHCATNNASQNVPAVFIRREHTIINEHRCRARMFSKHSQTEAVTIFVVANLVFTTGQRLPLLNEREQHIGFPNGVRSLHQRKNSLETCTCIN